MGAYGTFRVAPESGVIYGKRGKPVGRRDSDGYVQVTVFVDGRPTLRSAHRWIWEHARGPIPNGLEINHKNGVKTDNRIANLELVTHQENVKHAYRAGLKSNAGTKNPHAVLDDAKIRQIRARADNGEPHLSLAEAFGVSRRTINDIAGRRSWAHVED